MLSAPAGPLEPEKRMPERKRLGEILVDLQVLTDAELDQILTALRRRRDQTKFGRMGRDMGLLREEHILAALAVQMDMFPRIREMSLGRVLDELQQPAPPPPVSVARAARRGGRRKNP